MSIYTASFNHITYIQNGPKVYITIQLHNMFNPLNCSLYSQIFLSPTSNKMGNHHISFMQSMTVWMKISQRDDQTINTWTTFFGEYSKTKHTVGKCEMVMKWKGTITDTMERKTCVRTFAEVWQAGSTTMWTGTDFNLNSYRINFACHVKTLLNKLWTVYLFFCQIIYVEYYTSTMA